MKKLQILEIEKVLIYNTLVGYIKVLFFIMKVTSKEEYVWMNVVISKKETIISYTIAILFILAMVSSSHWNLPFLFITSMRICHKGQLKWVVALL